MDNIVAPGIRPLPYAIWTEHKATLIARYLRYFVMITKHGTYIDGFAGPQNDTPGMWAAELVLQTEPRWLRNFHLVEIDRRGVAALRQLRETSVSIDPKRRIKIYPGDFNVVVNRILVEGGIPEKEATFCLLDQRTFECHWSTLERLAQHKREAEHKIEIFYFFPIGWLHRAFRATRDEQLIEAWWGRSDWRTLLQLDSPEKSRLVAQRIRDELGYASVIPWPIYANQGSERLMYYMIHATDHSEAPKLMGRAYRRAVDPAEPIEQLKLAWESGDVDN